MAREYIKVDSTQATSPHAGELLSAKNALRSAYQQLSAVLGQMRRMHDGTTFTDLETRYGIPAGKGQAVFDMVNGSVGSMEGTFQTADAKNLIERVG